MNIIKTACLGLFALTFGLSGYAQSNKISVGIEGGPSLISLRGNDFIRMVHEPAIGYTGGLFFQYNFNRTFSLRTNTSYERKGSMVSGQATDAQGNPIGKFVTHLNFDYITLPLLIRASYGTRLRYFVNAGPYFGYLLRQTNVSSREHMPTHRAEFTSDFRRLDIGLASGLGISLPVQSRFALSFEVRNNLGLYNISARPVVNDGSIKTNATNFIFGVAYNFGKGRSQVRSIEAL
jgi:hypothetical protein